MWTKLIFILSLKICFAFDLPRKCICDLKINNDHYNVSAVYHVGGDHIYPMDAHYDVYGNLFYVEMNARDDGFIFNINIVKFNTTAPQIIQGLPKGISYSIAIDKKLSKVYFGTGKGMYAYHYDSQTAYLIFNTSLKLDLIFVDKNSNMYAIENVDGIEELYQLDGDNRIKCHSLEALNEMAIDDEDNFYFIREDKLCVLKSTHLTPQCIGDINYQGMAQITFHKSNVFIASYKLAYFHENDTGNIKEVENLPGNVTSMAFDNNGHFILGVRGKIFKYEKNDCFLRKNRIIDNYH